MRPAGRRCGRARRRSASPAIAVRQAADPRDGAEPELGLWRDHLRCAPLEGWRRLPLPFPRESTPRMATDGTCRQISAGGKRRSTGPGAGGEPGPWAFRIAWIALPFTAGPLLSDALSSTDDALPGHRHRRRCGRSGRSRWPPRSSSGRVTLTIVRVAGAGRGRGRGVGDRRDRRSIDGVEARARARRRPLLAAAAALSPLTGDAFVNGSAYGPERRMALRPTVACARARAARVGGRGGGRSRPVRCCSPRASSDRASPPSSSAAGWACSPSARCTGSAVVGSCSCPPVSSIHDPLTMSDAVLFPRRSIVRLGPAEPADAASDRVLDVTGGAPGLALHIEVDVPQSVGVRDGRRRTDQRRGGRRPRHAHPSGRGAGRGRRRRRITLG